MTELLLFLILIAIAAVIISTLRDMHDDGYGRRPPPPSHYADAFEPPLRPRTR
jgi:hypothetical protein